MSSIILLYYLIVNDSQDAMVVPLYTSMLSSDENDGRDIL